MKFSCLSVLRQGWLGIPLFLVGIASLAFSQLAQTSDNAKVSADELISMISSKLDQQNKIINDLNSQIKDNPTTAGRINILSNLDSVSNQDSNAKIEVDRLRSNLKGVEDAWVGRREELSKSIVATTKRVEDSQSILTDLSDNFAGRYEEAQPALLVLKEAVERTESESGALSKLMDAARKDASFGMQSLAKESEDLISRTTPPPPSSEVSTPRTSIGRNVSSVISSNEAVSLSSSDRFRPSISATSNILTKPMPAQRANGSQISKLESQLAASKNIQTELSEDTAQMQIELRRAYRDIVSLKNNLDESQQMVSSLERTKSALQNGNLSGQGVSAKSISDQINRLERELENARSDLRQSRQSLLMEQERSNSYIRSITTELERTRRELDLARSTVANAGVDSARLMALERELSQTKNALRMAQSAPVEASSRDFLDLQDELRKSLGEIARMQVELGEKKDLENQLLQLKSSLEDASDSPTRSASPAYVNKLLLDLNAAKKEVMKAKEGNRLERNSLAEKVQELEDQLKSSNLELVKTKNQFDDTQKQMAKREFDFANTIQSLEEDAQMAQEALREASLGKLPAIPFVNEMEQNLEDSETRIQELSARFESEQSRATDVIDGLKIELDNAVLRQKRALEQLSRRELELKGKDEELNLVLDEKQNLKEELEVVKVIAGQLQDLNQVLEETKSAQNKNNINTDEVVLSLRDELNKVKVELVFEREENEKTQAEAALQIANLEEQLVGTHNKLLSEQENLVNQTDESQDLVLDLKSELDKAREEIARMKNAGLGESVETRQAVSQLQEALGTIRILKESLEEAESYNLEVDNLRAELADAMSTQINTIQSTEADKGKLVGQISDLEAELMIMREEGKGASLERKKMVAQLNKDLKSSQEEISKLQKRVENSDDSSITAVVAVEEELLEANAQNAELRGQLESMQDEKSRTIDLLEKELASAVSQLDKLDQAGSDDIEELRKANVELADKLKSVDERNFKELTLVETELAIALEEKENAVSDSQKLLTKLQNLQDDDSSDLNNAPQEYVQKIDQLEEQLKEASARIEELANVEKRAGQDPVSDNSEEFKGLDNEALMSLEGELAGALEKLDIANDKIVTLITEKEMLADELVAQSGTSGGENEMKIKSLQEKLTTSLMRLAELENGLKEDNPDQDLLNGEAMQKLESQLALSEVTVVDLQEKLAEEREEREKLLSDFKTASEQIAMLENAKDDPQSKTDEPSDIVGPESIQLLEEQLVSSQLEVESLRQQNELEEQGRVALEQRLEKAIALISQSKVKPSVIPDVIPSEVAGLKDEIATKDQNINNLKEQLGKAIEELALKESELEIIQATSPVREEPTPVSNAEVDALNQEVADLKSALQEAKSDVSQPKPDDAVVAALREQLQNAVAEALEMEAELEETRKRMNEIEKNLADSKSDQFEELIQKAKGAEAAAFDKIKNLTAALRKSEELRKETEGLLDEAKNQQPAPIDITNDPRYQELQIEIASLKQELVEQPVVDSTESVAKKEELLGLQDDMRLLQEDLLNARNLEDPKVTELQNKLDMSRDDALKLNIEFKNAMEEFGRIKDQVTSLENENAKLRDISLTTAKSQADQKNSSLQNRINSLSNENSQLSVELGVKENRLAELREMLAQAQAGIPGLTADSAALKAQIIRLEGNLQSAQDKNSQSKYDTDAVKQQLAFAEERANGLEEQLRNTQSQLRNIPSRIPSLSTPAPIPTIPSTPSFSNEQIAELNNLRIQNQKLQSQLVSMTNRPDADRAMLDQKIRDLNQRNMSAQVQLDQERSQVTNLKKELADARNIKQEILDRGRSSAMKVELLNDELASSRNRMKSLEKALIGAREAIRVLRQGGNSSNSIQVSMPLSENNDLPSPGNVPFAPISRSSRTPNLQKASPLTPFNQTQSPVTLPRSSSAGVQNIPEGDAMLNLKVEVQFLNNRNRPAGFTEFFLVDRDLDQIMAGAGIRLPGNEGIGSYAEYWARSIQRGYRFPGAAASIRNALANQSMLRIKTNSLGEANIENVKAGKYFLVGASTLGQVGIVWSKNVDLSNGNNQVSLNLRDAAWAE